MLLSPYCSVCLQELKEFSRLNIIAYLRLNGVDSKEHSVFRELTRVKQYFEKIKAAESAGTKQNAMLDKAAAGRFIKHALVSQNRSVMKSANFDRNFRPETIKLASIWPSKRGRNTQPPIPDSKSFPGNRTSATTRPIGQVTTPTPTRSIWSLTMDQVRRG